MNTPKWLSSQFVAVIFLMASNALLGRTSHVDRAIQNSQERLLKQRKNALTRDKLKSVVVAEKKTHDTDLSKLSSRQRKRIKRKEITRQREVKTISEMNFDELMVTKNKHREAKNYETTLKYIDRMLLMCDPHEAPALILESADIFFEMENYTKSAARYAEFTLFYPGNPKIEYALWKGIESRFKTIYSPDRDQTRTHETLVLIDEYLARPSIFTNYADQVKNIQKQCLKNLALSELNICDFYLKQEKFAPVTTRLEKVRNDYLAYAPELEARIKEFEQKLPRAPESLEKDGHKDAVLTPLLAAEESALKAKSYSQVF